MIRRGKVMNKERYYVNYFDGHIHRCDEACCQQGMLEKADSLYRRGFENFTVIKGTEIEVLRNANLDQHYVLEG